MLNRTINKLTVRTWNKGEFVRIGVRLIRGWLLSWLDFLFEFMLILWLINTRNHPLGGFGIHFMKVLN